MPEVELTIDATTGELTMHVKGIAEPACEDVARLAEEVLGQPAENRRTSEYHLQPRVQPRVQPGRSQ
jgi:hypothetical protein